MIAYPYWFRVVDRVKDGWCDKITLLVDYNTTPPEGYRHINKGMAVYTDPQGRRVRTSTDDPRVLSGELTSTTKGRSPSELNRKITRERSRNYVTVVFQDTLEQAYVRRDDPVLDARPCCFVQKGRPKKKSHPDVYRNAALNRPSKTCSHCGRMIKVNVFGRYHGDNCKERKSDD